MNLHLATCRRISIWNLEEVEGTRSPRLPFPFDSGDGGFFPFAAKFGVPHKKLTVNLFYRLVKLGCLGVVFEDVTNPGSWLRPRLLCHHVAGHHALRSKTRCAVVSDRRMGPPKASFKLKSVSLVMIVVRIRSGFDHPRPSVIFCDCRIARCSLWLPA